MLLLHSKWDSLSPLYIKPNATGDVRMLTSVIDRIIVALQSLRRRLKSLNWPYWLRTNKFTRGRSSDASGRDEGAPAQSDEFVSPWGGSHPGQKSEQPHKNWETSAKGESVEDGDAPHSARRNEREREMGEGRQEDIAHRQTGIEISDILIPLFLVIGVGFLVGSIFGSPFGGWFVIGGVIGMAGRDILERSKGKRLPRQVRTGNIYKIITLLFLAIGIWFLFDPELGWFFAASFIAVGIIGIAGWDIIPVILFFFMMSFALWLNSIFKFARWFDIVDFIEAFGDFIEMLANSI